VLLVENDTSSISASPVILWEMVREGGDNSNIESFGLKFKSTVPHVEPVMRYSPELLKAMHF
jgi:hypothetical protein